MTQTIWPPTTEEFRAAEALLQGIRKPWAESRLAILTAFSKHPGAACQRIARAVGTRTKVVARLLDGWRTCGECALSRFGRPKDVSAEVLIKLRVELESKSLCSLEEVTDWLADEKKGGVKLSCPTVRRYCRKLGFNLPARRRPPTKPAGRPRKYRWNAQQIAELKSCAPSLGRRRATALLKIGTESKTIGEVARECGVDYWRLRLDLKYFVRGRLKQMIRHSPSADVLVVKGKQQVFFDWCNRHYELTNKVPRAAAVQKFLASDECQIRMPRRTIYNHLLKWRKTRRIAARKYRINLVRMAR